ncbi:hypothetical protein, partial [Catellatospora chokoriensis]|uniref:hypothetical protein n=1 Tax=Catellatospora chokoriensis TaxID=310353 RepID=UPI0019403BE9
MLTETTAATRVKVTSHVLLAIWSLNSDPATPTASGLSERLARRLVLTYTRRDDTVVSLSGRTSNAASAVPVGRNHVAVNAPA